MDERTLPIAAAAHIILDRPNSVDAIPAIWPIRRQ